MRSHQHKLEPQKPSLEQLLEESCDVCFVPFEKVQPKRIEEGLQILLCSRCHIHVHRCCYQFQPSCTVMSDRVSQFLCDKCKYDNKGNPTCIVCRNSDGAMKLIGQKQLIHVYCGLVHNDIQVTCYYPTISFRKSMYYEEVSHVCEVCHNKNAHDQCSQDSCKRKVHTYCAKKMFITLSKDAQEPSSWNHHLNAGNNNIFDISDQTIPYALLSQDVETSLKQVEQLGLDLSCRQKFKQSVYKDYSQQVRSRRKTTKKLRRGGFSYVNCPIHQAFFYCSCFQKSEGDMVLCECCFVWYHQKCIKFNGNEQNFICQFCRTFYDFKRRALDELRGGRGEYELTRVDLPLSISLMDLMWLLRVIDNRIRGGLAAKMLKQLVKYPLKSSCMDLLIRHHNRNKLTALADECLTELATSAQLMVVLRPRGVLMLDAQGKSVRVGENVEFNQRVRKALQLLLGLGLRGQGFTAILKELEFKERALSDQYEQIIELSKVEQQYQEVQILKQKAKTYDFIEIIKKINEKQNISFQQLNSSKLKAKNVASLPIYLTNTLNQKFQQVSPIIDNINKTIQTQPQNTYLISRFIEQLSQHHVQPPIEYIELKMQKKFIQDLHLYFIKQEGLKLDQEKSTDQKINDLLNCSILKPSQQLTDIINSYRPTTTLPVWKNVNTIAERCQIVAIEFEIKQILKRRFCKQEKFLQLMQRAGDCQLSSASQDVRNVVNSWNEVKVKLNSALNQSLENVDEIDELSDIHKIVLQVVTALQNFPIKVQEDQGKVSLISQLKTRKQELQQLKILYTESQLQKNPLTITKLCATLPKNNKLVKQYSNLKREQANLTNKFTTILAKISERIQSFKSQVKKQQRKDQIKQNGQKPSLSQINQFIEILKHSNVDMSRQIRELTRIINNSLDIARKVKTFLQQRGDIHKANLQELSSRRKQMDDLRKKVLNVAQLNLKTELTDLYHMQICNRMRTALLSPNLQLQKINTLLKFAQEEGLNHVESFISLKQKYQTKNQKSKQVNMIKHLEQSLMAEATKDTTPNFSSLFIYRRSLQIPDINDIKIKNSYIEEVIEKNKQIREKVSHVLQQKPHKWDFSDSKTVYVQALKSPFLQPQLNRLNLQITKAADLFKRWKDLGKSYNHLHPIFLDYDMLSLTIEEIQMVKRQLKNNQDQLGKLSVYVSNFDQCFRDNLQEIVERIQNNNVIRDSQVCQQAEIRYLQFWIKMLNLNRKNKQTVPYEKVKKLLLDSYNLLQRMMRRGDDYEQLKTIIYELQDCMSAIKSHLRQNPPNIKCNYLAEEFIDLQELYLQNDGDEDLTEFVPLLRPFSDLSKFRMKNLNYLEARRQDISLKRSRDKLDDLRGDSEKHITLKMDQSSSEQVPQVVSDNQRKKIKEIFFKNIRKNIELKKYGECQNEVKMIQNQIFGEWHNDIIKYFQMSEQFQKLFIKLITCPHISNKIIKKKFQFKFIQLLVTNLHKIDELESMLASKQKEQEQQKAISKISETIEQKPLPSQNQQQFVIDSIARGQMDDSLRQDLKKEMKMIKESKHKKKKHHKHRSRSRSPDAKFSSESQKQLPSYIQNEYNKEEGFKNNDKKPQLTQKMSNQSPLRYDPEEEELQQKQHIFPKGSLLKLRNCDVQLISKKKGRVEFPVELMTEQQHKKLLTELIDPGFSKLPIRKQKSDIQIIQYINKSKKKYKYLVGWFQALNQQDNEYLRQLSVDASQRKKIFGWQNQHIKVHIMSIRQLVQITRFNPPGKVSSNGAAQILNQDRMVFILQFPQKIYQIKDIYRPFSQIQRRVDEFPVSVPTPYIEQTNLEVNPYFLKYNIPSILPTVPKQPQMQMEEPKHVEYEGWGNEPAIQNIQLPPPQPIQVIPPQPASNLPYKLNQIRMHYSFGNFSPILTDQDDNDNDRNKQDLAGNLLSSLGVGDIGKIPPPSAPSSSQPQMSRDKQAQQQYQGYYGNYGYQSQGRNIQQPDNRWNNYQPPQQSQPPIAAGMPQGQVYNPLNPLNPLNPMAGKYPNPNPPMNPLPNQMYKNPMSGNPRPPSMNMGNQPSQYYPRNDGYDSRYQGGYQQ